MPIIPNTDCALIKTTGERNVYGQPTEIYETPARCVVIKLTSEWDKTSVRADSSASRGNAEEIKADARLLFEPHWCIKVGDLLKVLGVSLRVTAVRPRIDFAGRHDHDQVDAKIWE